MTICLRVTVDKETMYIGYRYIYQKVFGSIVTEGGGSTEPGVPYLYNYPGIFSRVYIYPVLRPHVIGRYFIACN